MTMDDLVHNLEAFRNKGGVVEVVRCKDPTLVLSAQEALGLQFSPEFILFYQTYKYLQVGYTEFIAVGHLCSDYQSQRSSRKLPALYCFPVLNDESGGYYYLRCAKAGVRPGSEFGNIVHYGSQSGDFRGGHSGFLDFVRSVVRLWEGSL
jgi:hypothetical protein